ncbi:MAG: P-loop NTPase [Gemmatimonadota bacterium]
MPTDRAPGPDQSPTRPPGGAPVREKLPGVRHIVAVASGKGGVGKSTVSVNLALALSRMGTPTGLVDADLFGPSIPVMLGIPRGPRPTMTAEGRIVPLERSGLKVISMGILTGDDEPAILRGPMVSKYLQAFVTGVAWGKVDHLILDLPPGTGDTQLTLSQGVPLSGAIIVTTPQDVSLRIARRGLRMFEKVQVPILGIIENMSSFLCSHCGETTDIFRRGGGRRMSEELGVPFLGAVPIDPEIVTGGDEGRPIVTGSPDSRAAVAYRAIATQLVRSLDATPEVVLEPFVWSWGDDKTAPSWLERVAAPEGGTIVPVGLRRRDPRTLSILWQDGRRQDHDVRDLRLACPCAACVDETTGRRRLDPKTVRRDVAPRVISSVGSYAINIAWNDGHRTGFYSFELLRSLAERGSTRATKDDD